MAVARRDAVRVRPVRAAMGEMTVAEVAVDEAVMVVAAKPEAGAQADVQEACPSRQLSLSLQH
jgi:hypothetical protein